MEKIKIKEIFESIQGEGPYIGVKQLFIRFCDCNLRCNYCDTDFLSTENYVEYTQDELLKILKNCDVEKLHSVSLTGGEPLMHTDFLKSFLPKLNLPVYLETNATKFEEIKEIIKYVDYISADIKLPSSCGLKNLFNLHEKFFKVIRESAVNCVVENQFNCKNKVIFAKVVFDETITDEEIEKTVELAKKHSFELILQPKMNGTISAVTPEGIIKIYDKFLALTNNVRVIPQSHKLINIQ